MPGRGWRCDEIFLSDADGDKTDSLNPGLERAFQPRGFLLPLQAVDIMPKNVVKSVFGSASSRRRAQNVAIRIVHTAIADLFCASQSGSLQVVNLPRDWTTGSLKRSPSNAQQ
jgi:hypothetical protein